MNVKKKMMIVSVKAKKVQIGGKSLYPINKKVIGNNSTLVQFAGIGCIRDVVVGLTQDDEFKYCSCRSQETGAAE